MTNQKQNTMPCLKSASLARYVPANIPGYRVEYRVTLHPDAGSREGPIAVFAFAGIWIPHRVRKTGGPSQGIRRQKGYKNKKVGNREITDLFKCPR